MSTNTTIAPLTKLPDVIADLTARVPGIAQAVTAASVDAWASDAWPSVIATLQRVQFDWRIRFVKKESETILFFQVGESEFVSLDATTSLSLLGAWGLEPLGPLEQKTFHRIVYFPVFLNANPSGDFANTFKPDGADASQTIFFRLGKDGTNILAVASPELGKKALLRYSPGGVPGMSSKNKYPLQAFVDLSMTLRDWVAAGAKIGSPIQVAGPAPRPSASQQILTGFVEAYARCINAVRIDSSAISPLDQRFRISDYSVQLEMALAADGSLAERSKDEKARLGVKLTIAGTDPTTVQAVSAMPNFIVSGQLYDEIFDSLGRSMEAAKFGSVLGEDKVVVMAFADSARSRSAILKSGSANGSTKLLMVLSGEMKGFPKLVIASATYDGQFSSVSAEEFPDDGSNVMVTFDDIGELFMPIIAGVRVLTNELSAW